MDEVINETERGERIRFIKSKINVGMSKVGTFFKKSVKAVKDNMGLLPYYAEKGYLKAANYIAAKREEAIERKITRREWIISKVDVAAARVGTFNRKVVNGFKTAFNKIKSALRPSAEKREELKLELERLKNELKRQREYNEELNEAASYENLRGR